MSQLARRYHLVIAALVPLFLVQAQVAGAESKNISGTGRAVALLSESKVSSSGEPQHDISVIVREDTDRSPAPDFDNAKVHHVSTSDCVAGNCTDKGYRTYNLRTGDRTFAVYEGTIKIVPASNGPPDVSFAGKWWFIGGQGKFRGITGGGTYKGELTPTGVAYSWEGEYEVK